MDATVKFLLEEMGVSGLPWILLIFGMPAMWFVHNRRVDKLQDRLLTLQKDSITAMETATSAIMSTRSAVDGLKDILILTTGKKE